MAYPIKQLSGLEELIPDYDVILCDIWGVVHNGVRAFEAACHALTTAREKDKIPVILLTNAPRPAEWIARQLADLNVDRSVYDRIVTSGDMTRLAIAAHPENKVFPLGPERDLSFYEGLDIDLVDAKQAKLVSITGLFDDDNEVPDDYHEMLLEFKDRGLDVICANPDIVVERGDKLVYCGGALAEKYRELGGTVSYFGKPHAPVYDEAKSVAKTLLSPGKFDPSRVLAIGDGIMTDVKGALDAKLDCLFITGGIHSAENGPLFEPTPQKVTDFLSNKNLQAKAFMPKLTYAGGSTMRCPR